MTSRTVLTVLSVLAIVGFIVTIPLWLMMYLQHISLYRWFGLFPLAFAVASVLLLIRLKKTNVT